MSRSSRSIVALLLAVAAVVSACSSSDATAPPPCNVDPFSCPFGTTCWELDANTYKCLNSGLGKSGDPCVNRYGQPTCGDGLFCFMGAAASGGECTPFCSSAHPCASPRTCGVAYFPGGATISICSPAPAQMDGGAEGGAPDGSSDGSADGSTDAADATGQ